MSWHNQLYAYIWITTSRVKVRLCLSSEIKPIKYQLNLGVIDRFLATYQMVALIGELSYRRDRGCWYSYCYLRRVLQVYWLPTLKELRAAIRAPPQQARPSAAVRTELQGLHTEWIALGEAFNLSQNSREDDTGLTDYVTAKQLRSGCYFAECLCYGKKPAQKRPRCVCKGCWSVKYCGKRCQKK